MIGVCLNPNAPGLTQNKHSHHAQLKEKQKHANKLSPTPTSHQWDFWWPEVQIFASSTNNDKGILNVMCFMVISGHLQTDDSHTNINAETSATRSKKKRLQYECDMLLLFFCLPSMAHCPSMSKLQR